MTVVSAPSSVPPVSTPVPTPGPLPPSPQGPFARVVVGVDRSEASCLAARQAAGLLAPDGQLTLVSAYSLAATVSWGYAAYPPLLEELEQEAEEAVKQALDAVGAPYPSETPDAEATQALLKAIRAHDADLVAVGSHGHRRLPGILLGSTATNMLHKAPCPVLLARPALGAGLRLIDVAVDGSPESQRAYALARALAERSSAQLTVVVARGAHPEAVEGVDDDVRVQRLRQDPVTALVGRSGECDLLVLGSRGLSGLKALGSVSERVAHRASCSVLVAR